MRVVNPKNDLNSEAIAQFQRIYKLRFGVELSQADALEKSIKLMNLFRSLQGCKRISCNTTNNKSAVPGGFEERTNRCCIENNTVTRLIRAVKK